VGTLASLSILFFCFAAVPADAHFFGATVQVDGFDVVFSPIPNIPVAGSNSTYLNFSVLKNGTNISNIQAALVITEKDSGVSVEQIPYRAYEFSDISIPYTFQKAGSYTVALLVRITDDEKFQANPLEAKFDLSVENPGSPAIPFDELMLYYVTPAGIVVAALSIYLHSKKKI
jgi:hypothetical protein